MKSIRRKRNALSFILFGFLVFFLLFSFLSPVTVVHAESDTDRETEKDFRSVTDCDPTAGTSETSSITVLLDGENGFFRCAAGDLAGTLSFLCAVSLNSSA